MTIPQHPFHSLW
jgi:hypothetical protein